MLPNSLSYPPESVCHDCCGAEKVDGGSEAANGEVSLILDGAVAAGWRHVLRHLNGGCGGFNWLLDVVVMRMDEVAGARDDGLCAFTLVM